MKECLMPAPIVELSRATAAYDDQLVWDDLDFTLAPGQFAAVVGPTGGGKSTLLKYILGLLPQRPGTLRARSQLTIGYVPQRETITWQFPVTVEQVVRMGRYRQTCLWPWSSRADRQQAAALLERLGLSPYAKRHIDDLSGGQQQRVFLARALIGSPQLLLLDEPTAGVDMKTQHEILHVLRELNGEGMTILLTTHDLNTIASHVPWVICFNHGIVAQGPPAAVLTPPILRRTYDADMMVVTKDGMTFIANASLVHRHGGARQNRVASPQRTADGTAS
jgi:zinc/manganese transport system ATP-binding protein/zinc transport system ATP-binding protein